MKRCPVTSFFLVTFVYLLSRTLHSTLPHINYCVKVASQCIVQSKVGDFCKGFYMRLCVCTVNAFCPPACIRAGSVAFSQSAQQKWKRKHLGNDLKRNQLSMAGRPCTFPADVFIHTVLSPLWEFICVQKDCGGMYFLITVEWWAMWWHAADYSTAGWM